jgi:hypothetical protein
MNDDTRAISDQTEPVSLSLALPLCAKIAVAQEEVIEVVFPPAAWAFQRA